MYTFTSIVFSLITLFMFLRMHHVHGSDTQTERFIITIGAILFLIQAGLSYHSHSVNRPREKRVMTFGTAFCTILYAILFFLFVDFGSDSIFSSLLGQ